MSKASPYAFTHSGRPISRWISPSSYSEPPSVRMLLRSSSRARPRTHSAQIRCRRSAAPQCRAPAADPFGPDPLESLRSAPVPSATRERDAVFGDQTPGLLPTGDRAVGERIDEIGHDLLDQPRPFRLTAGVTVKSSQALHRADHHVPQTLPPCQLSGTEQVGLLGPENINHVPVAFVIPPMVVLPK